MFINLQAVNVRVHECNYIQKEIPCFLGTLLTKLDLEIMFKKQQQR